MFPKVFSKRSQGGPDILTAEIDERVRVRIFTTLQHVCQNCMCYIDAVMEDVGNKCFMIHGGLYTRQKNGYQSPSMSDRAVESLMACPSEIFVDMLELFFQSHHYTGIISGQEAAVGAINGIFREEGVGFQLTEGVVHQVKGGHSMFGPGGIQLKIDYPQATRTTDHAAYQTTIQPTLQLLSKKGFETANTEMLSAHEHFRNGKWSEAITSAGKSLESVLKTICETKKWPYDKDRAALGTLVSICTKNGLYQDFYDTIIVASGTIRNKIGAHGQGPNPPHDPADEANAEHMLQMTSSHILFLVRRAGM